MNKALLHTQVQEFIHENLNTDVNSLAFKTSPFPEISMAEIITQLRAKQKAKQKLPHWYTTENIMYPEKISLEQTSSEATASYKASLIEGDSLVDLTGGFGVDCFYFAKKFKKIIHLEKNKSLSVIAQWNFTQLETANVECLNADAISFLKEADRIFDWIYADPSRRNIQQNKVFLLSDCTPDIPKHLNEIWKYTHNLLIKTSPLIDLKLGIQELRNVKEIHIVAVKNEVKELNWVLQKGYTGAVKINCIDLKSDYLQPFVFQYDDEKKVQIDCKEPLTYLYEPNAAILKSGAFKTVAHNYKVFKLATHSHLYTSNEIISFPGRSFQIMEVLPFQKKQLRKRFSKTKANITTRNFPWTVARIRKELQIKDGGELFLFFTTSLNNKHLVIICKKT